MTLEWCQLWKIGELLDAAGLIYFCMDFGVDERYFYFWDKNT